MGGFDMNMRYDSEVDALYIQLTPASIVRSEQVETGTLVDLDRTGMVVGVEVIRPARHWPLASILSGFQVADPDANILRALWGLDAAEAKAFPFTTSSGLLATGS
jgi:uncharacterized protein YuzE